MRRLTVCACVLLIAGCGEDPMRHEAVLAEADALERPVPGLYRSSARLVSFEMPGLPPAEADRFRERFGGMDTQDAQRCITRQESEDGFEDLLRTIGEGVNGMQCAFERFDTDPPKLDAVLSCQGTPAMQAEIAFNGTAAGEELALVMDMQASSPVIPGSSMKMQFDVSARRVGECPEPAA